MVLDEALLVAQLIKDGDISPELLQGLGDAAMLEDAVGSQYELEELVKGKIEERGKMKLKPKQLHGGTERPQTIDALLMAVDAEKNGTGVITGGAGSTQQEVSTEERGVLGPAVPRR